MDASLVVFHDGMGDGKTNAGTTGGRVSGRIASVKASNKMSCEPFSMPSHSLKMVKQRCFPRLLSVSVIMESGIEYLIALSKSRQKS